jgi:2-dehydropantoate 2-reductase
MDRTIHILGLGNIGKYIAHGLIRGARQQGASPAASCRKPTVTLLFHRPGMLDEWEKAGCAIESTTLDTASSQSSNSSLAKSTHARGFHVELLNAGETTPIKNLIVATKTYTTTSALAPLRHRLGRDSHILFVQNGMGMSVQLHDHNLTHTAPRYLWFISPGLTQTRRCHR